ncbi:hypothetical protein GCM10018793_46010 [Streptomyces sulfonofaciens]|uniref:Uncharacterized protein n=1 Tax=Streptomyces sulfonofaciens TaxID=68272 RepID=A0A919L4E1_9ACTN|nr:hypothetical protein GCM10018793_46010 [Streptomyces sulfonofaciens]
MPGRAGAGPPPLAADRGPYGQGAATALPQVPRPPPGPEAGPGATGVAGSLLDGAAQHAGDEPALEDDTQAAASSAVAAARARAAARVRRAGSAAVARSRP